MSVDLETVISMATYRVGFLPPKPDSLAAGELYVELPADGLAPRLWVGVLRETDVKGHIVSLVPAGVELPDPPATTAPVNVDVPAVMPLAATVADTLTCTMGNWNGEPSNYHYQWQRDGVDIGTDSASYVAVDEDVDHSVACVVTAENAIGSTAAPPSNAVAVTATAAREATDNDHDKHKRPHHR